MFKFCIKSFLNLNLLLAAQKKLMANLQNEVSLTEHPLTIQIPNSNYIKFNALDEKCHLVPSIFHPFSNTLAELLLFTIRMNILHVATLRQVLQVNTCQKFKIIQTVNTPSVKVILSVHVIDKAFVKVAPARDQAPRSAKIDFGKFFIFVTQGTFGNIGLHRLDYDYNTIGTLIFTAPYFV